MFIRLQINSDGYEEEVNRKLPSLDKRDEKLGIYYPKTINGRYLLPWERQIINSDFLEHERKRIKEVADWRNGFDRSPMDSKQKEVDLYVVPMEYTPALRAAIAKLEDCAIRGLSALRNSSVGLLVGLFPRSGKVPTDYSYIRIRDSRRAVIAELRSNLQEYALIVENWEYSDPVSMYRGLDYEKGILSKIINENFRGDKHLALSLQTPVFSAPYVPGSLGGISFSSFTRQTNLIKELDTTFQLMVPPEFRIQGPPSFLYNGVRFQYSGDVIFKVAERPILSGNALSTIGTGDYLQVKKQRRKRERFAGEYSIFSMIHTSNDKSASVLKELYQDFNKTEVTFPKDLEKEMFYEDIVRIRKSISEEVWLQNVAIREINPGADSTVNDLDKKYMDILWDDFDTILSDSFRGEHERDILVRSLLPVNNFKRLIQSVARIGETSILTEDHFKTARGLIVDNFSGFVQSKEIANLTSRIGKRHADLRFTSIETLLANKQPWMAGDIYERLKSDEVFQDLIDLQGILEWMREKGYVIRDELDRYRWVGRVI